MAKTGSKLAIDALLAFAEAGGEMTKKEFHAIFAKLRGASRFDMNYGGWVRDDQSGVLQRVPKPDKPEDEAILRITPRGWDYLKKAGVQDEVNRIWIEYEERLDTEMERDTNETYTAYLDRKSKEKDAFLDAGTQ